MHKKKRVLNMNLSNDYPRYPKQYLVPSLNRLDRPDTTEAMQRKKNKVRQY